MGAASAAMVRELVGGATAATLHCSEFPHLDRQPGSGAWISGPSGSPLGLPVPGLTAQAAPCHPCRSDVSRDSRRSYIRPGRGGVYLLPAASVVGNNRRVPRDGSNVRWKGIYVTATGFRNEKPSRLKPLPQFLRTYRSKGYWMMMFSERSGPVDTMWTGAPQSSSIAFR
mgnify:CR=1 FL=1